MPTGGTLTFPRRATGNHVVIAFRTRASGMTGPATTHIQTVLQQETGGTGLGLPRRKNHIEHDGSIECESTQMRHPVIIRLPLTTGELDAMPKKPDTSLVDDEEAFALPPKKILSSRKVPRQSNEHGRRTGWRSLRHDGADL